MTALERRRGWCPGALRPMRTGDGLLARVRITAGILAPALAGHLADCAERFGNGLVDLTSRANLQLRGVRGEALAPLQEALMALGLLDDSAEAESVRNVMVSPLAGIDPDCAPATLDVARRLEARLSQDAALRGLPPKFGFLVDGGGKLPLAGLGADVALRSRGDRFDVEAGGRIVESVPSSAVVEAAVACALAAVRGSHARRPAPFVRPIRLAGHDPRAGFFAAAVTFGRLDAGQLRLLAALAREHGAGLRLTPWRAVLLAPVAAASARAIASRVAAAGLVVDPADPRLAVAACSGRPACLSGEADVRRDAALFAQALAPRLAAGAMLHVSGCSKGCAHRGPADVTLVAEAGRYRLALDAAAGSPGEGEALPPAAMAARLRALAGAERNLSEGQPAHV